MKKILSNIIKKFMFFSSGASVCEEALPFDKWHAFRALEDGGEGRPMMRMFGFKHLN